MGLRAGLDGCGKISSPPGFDPRTVQPVASRYTDWMIIIIIIIKTCHFVVWRRALEKCDSVVYGVSLSVPCIPDVLPQ